MSLFAIVSVVVGPSVTATTTAVVVNRNANREKMSDIFELKESEGDRSTVMRRGVYKHRHPVSGFIFKCT